MGNCIALLVTFAFARYIYTSLKRPLLDDNGTKNATRREKLPAVINYSSVQVTTTEQASNTKTSPKPINEVPAISTSATPELKQTEDMAEKQLVRSIDDIVEKPIVKKARQRAHKLKRIHSDDPSVHASPRTRRHVRSLSVCSKHEHNSDVLKVKRLQLTVDLLREKVKDLDNLVASLEEDSYTETSNDALYSQAFRMKIFVLTLENQLAEAKRVLVQRTR
mmetsp:Transcript_10564/g.11620  ORF Transcript_10564/g.11620 Transcript_10564/m.11620 type:complete len:221 (+) Transcript_10564:52-714(+)